MSSSQSDKQSRKKRKKCTEDALRTRIENRVVEQIGNDRKTGSNCSLEFGSKVILNLSTKIIQFALILNILL